MGAIISRRKGAPKQSAVVKAQAVQAFNKSQQQLNGQEARKDNNQNAEASRSPNDTRTDIHPEGNTGPPADGETSVTVVQVNEKASPSKDVNANEGGGADGAATTIQSHYRGFKERKDYGKKKDAAVVIQKHVRGHQVRQDAKKNKEAAVKIQRSFRNFLGSKDEQQSTSKKEEGRARAESTDYDRPWKNVTNQPKMPKLEMKVGEKTKESFEHYQDDITLLRWQGEQQKEQTTLGDDYKPQKILLIASNTKEIDALKQAVLEDVRLIVYDFANLTFHELQEEIHRTLTEYREGSRARSIGVVCQGEPGVVYILRGKAFTVQKLENDSDLKTFIQCVGTLMSKLDPSQTCFHFIANDVGTNKTGQKLLKELGKAAQPSKVKFESPNESSEDGSRMVQLYFDGEKYIAWKKLRNRVSK